MNLFIGSIRLDPALVSRRTQGVGGLGEFTGATLKVGLEDRRVELEIILFVLLTMLWTTPLHWTANVFGGSQRAPFC